MSAYLERRGFEPLPPNFANDGIGIESDFTPDNWGNILMVDTNDGDVTITLPPITAFTQQGQLIVTKIDSSANKVIVVPNVGQSINELSNPVNLTKQKDSITFLQNGATSIATMFSRRGGLPATVGENGTYPTLYDALTAGETDILINSAATEGADIIFTQGFTLNVAPNVIWDLGNYQLIAGANNLEITYGSEGIIKWSPTGFGRSMIDGSIYAGIVLFRNSIKIDGSDSTAAGCYLYDHLTAVISTGITQVTLPNVSNWGLYLDNVSVCAEGANISFFHLATSGNNISSVIVSTPTDVKKFTRVSFSGNFDPFTSLVQVNGWDIDEIVFQKIGSTTELVFYVGGTVRSATCPLGGDLHFVLTVPNTTLMNVKANNGTISAGSFLTTTFINVRCGVLANLGAKAVLDNVQVSGDNFPVLDNLDLNTNLITLKEQTVNPMAPGLAGAIKLYTKTNSGTTTLYGVDNGANRRIIGPAPMVIGISAGFTYSSSGAAILFSNGGVARIDTPFFSINDLDSLTFDINEEGEYEVLLTFTNKVTTGTNQASTNCAVLTGGGVATASFTGAVDITDTPSVAGNVNHPIYKNKIDVLDVSGGPVTIKPTLVLGGVAAVMDTFKVWYQITKIK